MKSFHTDKGCLKLDALWNHLGEMKDVAEGSLRFPGLRLAMRLILTIAHSNAKEERVFLIVRKKTCFRPNLDPEETLASIFSVKLAMEVEEVECFKIPDEILRDAKSATFRYRPEHPSTT